MFKPNQIKCKSHNKTDEKNNNNVSSLKSSNFYLIRHYAWYQVGANLYHMKYVPDVNSCIIIYDAVTKLNKQNPRYLFYLHGKDSFMIPDKSQL